MMGEGEASGSDASRAGHGGANVLRGVVVVGLVVAALFFGRRVAALLPQFATWVEGLGALGPAVFVAGYAAAVVGFVPGSLLTLAGGALFGVARGVVYVFAAAVLGSTVSFLIARHLARDAVARRIEGDARFRAIDRAIGEQGRRIVLLLRLSPVFPFSLLNYALGLTRVRLIDYLIAAVGMLPGTVLYVYLGKLGGDVAAVAGGVRTERGPADWALLGVGLAATAAVTFLITRIARRALDEATAEESAPR
ncbi:MAG: TVP38/TMEM64 family protein [Myxococcota bacterium]